MTPLKSVTSQPVSQDPALDADAWSTGTSYARQGDGPGSVARPRVRPTPGRATAQAASRDARRAIQTGARDQGLQQVVAGRTAGVGMTPYPEGTLGNAE